MYFQKHIKYMYFTVLCVKLTISKYNIISKEDTFFLHFDIIFNLDKIYMQLIFLKENINYFVFIFC